MKTAQLRLVSRVRELAVTGQARDRRLEARVALREVARALSTTPSTLHRWETGECRPPAESALKWGRLLEELTGSPL